MQGQVRCPLSMNAPGNLVAFGLLAATQQVERSVAVFEMWRRSAWQVRPCISPLSRRRQIPALYRGVYFRLHSCVTHANSIMPCFLSCHSRPRCLSSCCGMCTYLWHYCAIAVCLLAPTNGTWCDQRLLLMTGEQTAAPPSLSASFNGNAYESVESTCLPPSG